MESSAPLPGYCLAMSEENMESVRQVYAAYKRGDLDATARCLHPDVEWHPYLSAKRGLPKIRNWMNTNSWIVSEIVLVFLIVILLRG